MLLAALGFFVLLLLAFFGLPLGLAMFLTGIGGFALIRGLDPALALAGQKIVETATNGGFAVVPLFILMGEFIHRSKLSEELYDAANAWMGHRRGGLAMATIAACGGFAAVCGSSLAASATMVRVAAPSMQRYRYSDGLAAGSIAAGGTLGILIPPSVPLVLYGLMTETDIGKLFIAGIVPGIILATMFVACIWISVRIDPLLGPPGPVSTLRQRLAATRGVWGVAALIGFVLGGIYFGVFTPTEAAGMGSAGALAIAVLRRRLGWKDLLGSLADAAKTTGMIFTILFGALVFAQFLNLAGLPRMVVAASEAVGSDPVVILAAIAVIYLLLGCVFDSIGLLLLTVPVLFPIVVKLGLDPVWFGILVVVLTEISLITPPIGMNVFTVKTLMPHVSVWTIFRGVVPFIFAGALFLALLLIFPGIVTFLPKLAF